MVAALGHTGKPVCRAHDVGRRAGIRRQADRADRADQCGRRQRGVVRGTTPSRKPCSISACHPTDPRDRQGFLCDDTGGRIRNPASAPTSTRVTPVCGTDRSVGRCLASPRGGHRFGAQSHGSDSPADGGCASPVSRDERGLWLPSRCGDGEDEEESAHVDELEASLSSAATVTQADSPLGASLADRFGFGDATVVAATFGFVTGWTQLQAVALRLDLSVTDLGLASPDTAVGQSGWCCGLVASPSGRGSSAPADDVLQPSTSTLLLMLTTSPDVSSIAAARR